MQYNTCLQHLHVYMDLHLYKNYNDINIKEDNNIKTNTIKVDEVHCMSKRQRMNYQVF